MRTSSVCRAVFLDRDGVINKNRNDHVKTWAEFEFLPGVLDALRDLAMLDVVVIVITNQGAIGRGLTTFEAVDDIHARMILAVQRHGGRIDDVIYCPHLPSAGCACRKPQPGMLIAAAKKWQIDLAQSFLIGDADTDILAGRAAGCYTTLVLTGRASVQVAEKLYVPFVQDLSEAVSSIKQVLGLGGDNIDLRTLLQLNPPISTLLTVEDSWNISKTQI